MSKDRQESYALEELSAHTADRRVLERVEQSTDEAQDVCLEVGIIEFILAYLPPIVIAREWKLDEKTIGSPLL